MSDNDSDRTIASGGNKAAPPSNLMPRKPDPMLGTVFADRYTIISVLGRGGMGVVYKARHDLMDRMVAIKMMLPQLVSDDVSLARFQREARAASKINHPNVIAIHDFGMTPDTGVAYLVMDFVDGLTLSDAIKQSDQLAVERAGRILLQVCDALEHAHKIGIIHRDLKPGNIMLVTQHGQDDIVKILDFGVAKLASSENETDQQRLTTTGEIFGSPIYMSPEQCSGNALDARSDIYALGCVMYETLMGKPPCVGKNALETISRHVSIEPLPFKQSRPDLDLPAWVEAIVFKALKKDPSKRQQSMQEMFDELYTGLGDANSADQMKQIVSSLRSTTSSRPVIKESMVISKSQRTTTSESSRDQSTAKRPTSNKILWGAVAVAAVITVVLAGLKSNLTKEHKPQIIPTGSAFSVTPTNPLQHSDKPSGTPTPPITGISPPELPTPPTSSREKPTQSTLGMPEVKPHPFTPKPRKKSAEVDISSHETAHKSKKITSDSDSAPAVPSRRHRNEDFYDFGIRKEGEGNAVPLPVNPYGKE